MPSWYRQYIEKGKVFLKILFAIREGVYSVPSKHNTRRGHYI